MTRPVALISSAEYTQYDEDLPLLVGALHDQGVDAEVVDWHDRSVDWSSYELAVIRSPWDYTDDPEGFRATLRAVAASTTLANPLDVVEVNLDKRYLVALAQAGLPVVPTLLVDPGDEVDLPAGTEVVVKPTVSAGARDTDRYPPARRAEAEAHALRLLAAGRAVLVQPYVESVDERGETGLVYLGDEYSHAFRKGPILRPDTGFVAGLYREEEITAREPTEAEIEVAERVLDAVATIVPGRSRRDLLYARVDLVIGPDGPLLMELELVEPSLFLPIDPASAGRAAAVIGNRLSGSDGEWSG